MSDELALLDATAQAELVRQRKASPRELVDAAIARIERVNPTLNAVIIQRFEKARAEAALPELPHGPFRGVPFLLKDLICHSAGDPWGGRWVEHVVTRSVRDTAAVLDAVAGYLPGDPYTAPPPVRPFREEVGAPTGHLRIGLLVKAPAGQAEVHPECATAARETARLLESLGHRVEESFPAALGDGEVGRAAVTVITAATARDLGYWSERTGRKIGPGDVEPMTWAIAEMGRRVSASDYLRAIEYLHAHTRQVAAWSAAGFDLLLTPTLTEPPPRLGQFDPAPGDPLRGFTRGGAFVAFTMPFNVTGQPAISLPLHWSTDGLPIGVQLGAAYGREDLLLRIAAQLA